MYRMLKSTAVWSLSHFTVWILAVSSLSTTSVEAKELCHGGKVIWRGGHQVGCVFTSFGDAEKSMCKGATTLTPTPHTGHCWVCIEDQLVPLIKEKQRWGEVTVGVNQSGAPKGDFTCLTGLHDPPAKLPTEVRLKHKKTGKCIFGIPKDGDPVRNWGCWKDPNMVFVIDDLGGGEVRLRHKKTQKCLYGDPNDGGFARNWSCWDDPNMVFLIEKLGGGEVRLKHKKTQKCLYGDPKDNGLVRNWGCWNDPNMVFILEHL